MTRLSIGRPGLALVLMLTGCALPPEQPEAVAVQGATVVRRPASPSVLTVRPAYQTAGPIVDRPGSHLRSQILPGTGVLVGDRPPPVATDAQGDVTLNFTNAELRDVAKAVLGDILGLTYAVDPAAQGQLTIETARPIPRDQVLPTFEVSLRAANLVLIREGTLYTVMPQTDVQHQPGLVGVAEAGYGTEAVALRFVSADQLKKLLEPLVPNGAIAQADQARNILFIVGSAADRRNLRDLITQFDVDWLRGVSFALFVPRWTDSRNLVEQLTQLLDAEGVPTAGTIRFVPIQQLNGILAISSRPAYLERVRSLLDMLDAEAQGARRRLFVYHVQNGRARDLAKVLAAAFGADEGGAARAAAPQTAPLGLATGGGQGFDTPGAAAEGSLPPPPGPPTIDGRAGEGGGLTLDLGGAEGAIKVTADETTNALVVYATPPQYDVVADALRRLDVLPLQVLIESAITEVTLNDQLRYGVQWSFSTGNSRFNLSEGKTSLPAQVFPGFSYLLTNGDTITAVLNALSEITSINVISSPQLLVLNNQTASLQVGDQVPIASQSAVSTQNPDSPIVNSIEYRDTGVILKVTPRVNDTGVVLLDIAQEVSNVVETTTSDLDSPTIQQRRVASSVAIQDGQTIALGGLITENRRGGKSGVPVLKDLPLIGNLFGTTEHSRDRTELLILLTPHVVRNAADARRITDELREKIRGVEPLPLPRAPIP